MLAPRPTPRHPSQLPHVVEAVVGRAIALVIAAIEEVRDRAGAPGAADRVARLRRARKA